MKMKKQILFATTVFITLASIGQPNKSGSAKATDAGMSTMSANKKLFIDVHELAPGKVSYADVMAAHQKDLATEGKFDVNILKFWFDEQKGLVYCLSLANDSESIRKNHAEAHGLLPAHIYPVTEGKEAALMGKKDLYLDVHYLGAGNVTPEGVAAAHEKDLAVQKKYGVNLINYWVDAKDGVVMCLAEANDSTGLIETHREAHGLLPAQVLKVKQGQ
jgi:hypothetical protein